MTSRSICWTPQCCARHPRACRVGGVTRYSRKDEELERLAAERVRALASSAGDVAVSHTNAGNIPFARNWWRHLLRAGVQNFALLATDDDAFAALDVALPRHSVRCPRAIFSAEASGPMSYRSAGWTQLMFAVPRMVRWVLQLRLNVLWMDTDVVTLSDPFPHLRSKLQSPPPIVRGRAVTQLLASVDGRVPAEDLHECGRAYSADRRRWGRSAGGGKLCGGLFYLQHGEAAIAFVNGWEARLRAPGAGAKNQPHYNWALEAATDALLVHTLPCDLFPNGYRYARDDWRAAQRRAPLVVHNNWIKGHVAKRERFKAWRLWLGGEEASGRSPTNTSAVLV